MGESDHYDWMFERPQEAGGKLVSFRILQALDLSEPQEFAAVRTPDHRREYLEYEGPVSGGRGRVLRVASGECLSVVERAGEMEVVVRFDGAGAVEHRFVGRDEGTTWVFSFDRVPGR
ncbi:MAG TPA: hypothetical protein VD997_00580 [Phycisphaerales bacterium]|nr:hypothetical protein [Phycisphaerales bacterium]